ncbi:hypothetical protein [Pseudoramibacter alactolyticus]|nr:hypothetical protein [Pseudoramibacter alactolyticus]
MANPLGDGPDGDQSGGGSDAAPCWKIPIGVGALMAEAADKKEARQ